MNESVPPPSQHFLITQTSKDYKGKARACWIMLIVAGLFALIPGFGLALWFVGMPLLLVTFVVSIVIIARGGTASGLMVMLATVFVAPFVFFIGPMISTAIFGAVMSEAERARLEAAEQGEAPAVVESVEPAASE